MEQIPNTSSPSSNTPQGATATITESIPSFNQPQQVATPKAAPKIPVQILALVGAAVLVTILIFFGLRTVLSKTGSSQTTSVTKKETLTWWGLWEPSDVLTSVITQFQNDNPGVTITYSQQSPKDYRDRLQSAFARGQGPDIFRFHNTWVPMLSAAGVYSALPSNVMTTTEFEKTFYPVMQRI